MESPGAAREPPDIMNDPAFAPGQRRDTFSSTAGSDRVDTCRICRSEGSPVEALFHPCKCSGSIKFVHQDCLMEWLSHSHKKHCELCKTPFRFTKLYDANMPSNLPWAVFARQACLHAFVGVVRLMRMMLVAAVWLIVVPCLLRGMWRWMFWIADAAWAREAFIEFVRQKSVAVQQAHENAHEGSSGVGWLGLILQQYLDPDYIFNSTTEPFAYSFANAVARNLGFGEESANETAPVIPAFQLPQADPSILSSWTYLASMTSSPRVNRVILDICEGQLITSVVILGFILVFLIREWVVQQQPLVNLENFNNVQQQFREATERVRLENERLRAQEELLERHRTRMAAFDQYLMIDDDENSQEGVSPAAGWHSIVGALMDDVTEHVRTYTNATHNDYVVNSTDVTGAVYVTALAGLYLDKLEEAMYAKIATYSLEERNEWSTILSETFAKARAGEGVPTTSRAEGLRLAQEAANPDDGPARSLRFESPSSRNATQDDVRSISAEDDDLIGHEPLPITNAGPDAKINIARLSAGRVVIPPPSLGATTRNSVAVSEVASTDLNSEGASESVTNNGGTSSRPVTGSTFGNERVETRDDGRDSDQYPRELPLGPRVNFALEDSLDVEDSVRSGSDHVLVDNAGTNGINNDEDSHDEDAIDPSETTAEPHRRERAGLDFLGKFADWCWGDIEPQDTSLSDATPVEERRFLPGWDDDEEPFVPRDLHRPADVQRPEVGLGAQQAGDPDVVAAAAQAGLDAEALEDAEDLEGILELIGLQGPIIGLFQTSAFCTLLVGATILCAVFLPYLGGKLVLSLIGSPVLFCFKVPLQFVSNITDAIIDLVLFLSSWLFVTLSLACDSLSSAIQIFLPKLVFWKESHVESMLQYSLSATTYSSDRLKSYVFPADGVQRVGVSWVLLAASAHSHASLKEVQGEVDTIFSHLGFLVGDAVDTISSGTVLMRIYEAFRAFPRVAANTIAGDYLIQNYIRPIFGLLSGLRRGTLIFETAWPTQMDPALVYWDSADRTLAIGMGYIALAALAAIYVALDTPITKSESGQRTEKLVRDTLKQAGGVFKVILIISIEMLVFPLYCGILLDLAFLPLFKDGTVAARWEFARQRPYTFGFVHWFIGTCYMFHFALFVGMCRKILRKGVLWFIRDPDDPTFHPVRDVLERGVVTQLRKIAFSGLVYGALVILCLGGVIWTIGKICAGIFPIYWVTTEPVLEFPIDLLLYNLVTPLAIKLFQPSDVLHNLYSWWLRRCARILRLSHFLFDDRRLDEEGHYKYSWHPSNLPMRLQPGSSEVEPPIDQYNGSEFSAPSETNFKHDGKYVLTPCSDQYRPPKPGEAFLKVDEDDVFIVDKDGKKNEHFAKVYVPPLFRVRITLFMVCLWMFSAATGLCATLVPLVFGRCVLDQTMPGKARVNDIYAYSVGSYILGVLIYSLARGRSAAKAIRQRFEQVAVFAWFGAIWRVTQRAAKCIYLYGFLGIVLPLLVALVFQLYLILPLHTWSLSHASTSPVLSSDGLNSTLVVDTVGNITQTEQLSSTVDEVDFTHHTIHLLQDYALGLLYVRIAGRFIFFSPASRAAEAFRRVTANGYFDPDVRLATRFFIVPTIVFAIGVLVAPPIVAKIALTLAGRASEDLDAETLAYRYSFPVAALSAVIMLGMREVGKATTRWRARIKDEVYLVGERLHNFGERRPPSGSRSVARRGL